MVLLDLEELQPSPSKLVATCDRKNTVIAKQRKGTKKKKSIDFYFEKSQKYGHCKTA